MKTFTFLPGETFVGLTEKTKGVFVLTDDRHITALYLLTQGGESPDMVANFFTDMIACARHPRAAMDERFHGCVPPEHHLSVVMIANGMSSETRAFITNQMQAVYKDMQTITTD